MRYIVSNSAMQIKRIGNDCINPNGNNLIFCTTRNTLIQVHTTYLIMLFLPQINTEINYLLYSSRTFGVSDQITQFSIMFTHTRTSYCRRLISGEPGACWSKSEQTFIKRATKFWCFNDKFQCPLEPHRAPPKLRGEIT